MSWDSAGDSPAVGSSRSSTRGRPARARAISSWRCSPWDRLSTTVAARSLEADGSQRRTGAVGESGKAAERAEHRELVRRQRLGGEQAVVEHGEAREEIGDLKRPGEAESGAAMRREPGDVAAEEVNAPPLAGSSPAIRLNSVVLPAPLGPMRARRSPGRTASFTRVDGAEAAEGLRDPLESEGERLAQGVALSSACTADSRACRAAASCTPRGCTSRTG